MSTYMFLGVIGLITGLTIHCITAVSGIEIELGPGFELSQSIGPIYIEYGSTIDYREFLRKTSNNTEFWYTCGYWDKDTPLSYWSGSVPPSITGWSSIKEDTIDLLYTGNYMYPVLKDQALPLAKSFLGNFELQNRESIVSDLTTYLKYFDRGVLDVYSVSRNKLLIANSDDVNISRLHTSFIEWYNTWSNVERFKIFKYFYFPIDRDCPTWINLFNLVCESYPHPSTLLSGESWEGACDYFSFSTIDFAETGTRINLVNADPQIWVDAYTWEQAMFKYYDTSNGVIGFWTPADLVLNYKVEKIATLLEKKPQEVIAIFSNWLKNTGYWRPVYFNYISTEGFDWASDPQYSIEYVF